MMAEQYIENRNRTRALPIRGRIRAQSAISAKPAEKTRGKSTKRSRKMAQNGAFSRAESAIFRCSEPIALDCKTRVCQTLR
jgi:hypothetical protein